MRSTLSFFIVLTGMFLGCYGSQVSTLSASAPLQYSINATKDQALKSPMELLQQSACGDLIRSATNDSRNHLEKVLPNERFWTFIRMNSAPADDIMLIDTEKHSWKMMVNQAVALKMAGSKLKVLAVAHDSETCNHTIAKGIPCYYDHQWYKELALVYGGWADTKGPYPGYKLYLVMLVRMMTTTIALCDSRNVFLSDSDVLFYRDPMDFVFTDVNIMVTATPIGDQHWSGYFFSDQPGQTHTLNNGVVHYKSNNVTHAFLLTLAAHCISSLITKHGDPDFGFLQTQFNFDLKSIQLKVHPSRAVSNKTTHRLTSAAGYSNPAGECYDCYHGTVPWRSDIVPTSKTSELRVGIFPTARCISSANLPQRTLEIIAASTKALQKQDRTHWGWGELGGESRMLCVHANAHARSTGNDTTKMSPKEEWFHKINSWFL